MELRVNRASLDEPLAESSVHAAVLAEAQAHREQQGLGRIEHRIVGPAGRKLRLAFLEQDLGRVDGSSGLVEELPRLLVHADTASSRTLLMNGDSSWAQSSCETKTRLMLTLYFRESSETRKLDRSISAP